MGEQKKVTFKYYFSENYNPVYVNGAYGGVGPHGEIIINFYLERYGIPHSHTHLINDDGSLGPQIEMEPPDYLSNVIRFVETGIILNLENAKRIHAWLGKKIEELEKTIISSNKPDISKGGAEEVEKKNH
ncbi:MAG: hypothetical protein H0Z30_09525 [Candidatus Marinimicrobia bacterium]|nr:hypothetical protein [Candidatus Neomarinimicrobiota bacterium]